MNDFFIKHPFLHYVTRHPRAVALGIFSLIITNFLDGIYPLIIKEIIDSLEKKIQFDKISQLTIIFFLTLLTLSLTRYLWRLGFGYFGHSVGENLRGLLFNKFLSLDAPFFNRRPIGELISLITSDVNSFKHAVGPGLLVFADGVIITIIIIPIMLSIQWTWTIKTLFFLPFIPILIWATMRAIHKNFKIQQENFGNLTAQAQETLFGIRVIKSYSLEDIRNKQFESLSLTYQKSCEKVALYDSIYGPIMEVGVAMSAVILLFVAQDDLLSGAVTIGSFVAFHRYIQKIVWPLTALGLGLSMFQKGWTSFDRIKEVFLTEPQIKNNGLLKLTEFKSLEFRQVYFKYSDELPWALENINFKITQKDRLAITGPVGAGKSTLVQLLLRIYPLTKGQILINEIEYQDYDLESLRNILLLNPQESFLFSDTIQSNLSLASSASLPLEVSQKLLNTVDLMNEVNKLPEGLQTQIGEKGVNLSGGQKQRMSIARGLAKNSEVIILDDSLSAVDTKTESKIAEELNINNQTQIIIAHRLTSIENCSHLLVLKNGVQEIFGEYSKVAAHSPTLQNMLEIQKNLPQEKSI